MTDRDAMTPGEAHWSTVPGEPEGGADMGFDFLRRLGGAPKPDVRAQLRYWPPSGMYLLDPTPRSPVRSRAERTQKRATNAIWYQTP